MGADELTHLPDFIRGPVLNLAAAAGNSADQILFVLLLLISIPLGLIQLHLPVGPNVKHFYSAALGLLYMFALYGSGAWHCVLTSLAVYFAMPRMGISWNTRPYVIMILALIYCSGVHIYRLWVDYLGYHLDFSTSQMMVTVKMVTYAFNVADGHKMKNGEFVGDKASVRPPKEGATEQELKQYEEKKASAEKYAQQTDSFRRARALPEPISLLQYCSYMWFYGAVLAGPCYECRDYLDVMEGKLFQKIGRIPSPFKYLLNCIVWAVACYVFVFIAAAYLPVMGYVNDPASDFSSRPWWSKFSYIYVAVIFNRFKYYFAWFLSECGCVASGLGYNGTVKLEDGTVVDNWDRVRNVDVIGVEFGQSINDLTNKWNKGVNNWLKFYVYQRVSPPKFLKFISQKTFANFVTKFTSAIWHGFYPAYYLFFLWAAVINEANNLSRELLRPLFMKKAINEKGKEELVGNYPIKYLYDFAGYVCLMCCMNYLGVAFYLLRADWAIGVWASLYWIGHVFPVAGIILLLIFKPVLRSLARGGKRADKPIKTN